MQGLTRPIKFVAATAAVLLLSCIPHESAGAQTKPSTSDATQKTSAPSPKNEDVKPPAAATPLTPEQARLQAQIEKLYQLAQDLKAAVAKSNKDTLSVDVIKKADAVEKAAKSLKDQMKGTQQSVDHR